MLTFSQMVIRLLVALAIGALIGLERELVGKEAGIRTSMMVAGGAALFTMTALVLPYLLTVDPAETIRIIAGNAGFLSILGNVVVGVGFLGAGIIIKTENSERVHGLTTAAVVWFVAALGILIGVGLMKFATLSAVIIFILLFIFRRINIYEHFRFPDNV